MLDMQLNTNTSKSPCPGSLPSTQTTPERTSRAPAAGLVLHIASDQMSGCHCVWEAVPLIQLSHAMQHRMFMNHDPRSAASSGSEAFLPLGHQGFLIYKFTLVLQPYFTFAMFVKPLSNAFQKFVMPTRLLLCKLCVLRYGAKFDSKPCAKMITRLKRQVGLCTQRNVTRHMNSTCKSHKAHDKHMT